MLMIDGHCRIAVVRHLSPVLVDPIKPGELLKGVAELRLKQLFYTNSPRFGNMWVSRECPLGERFLD